MAFHDLSYAERMKKGGDPAENKFRLFAKERGVSAEHYGFDRSSLRQFWKLPNMIKVTPDFACVGKVGFLVECKGVGREKAVKMKHEDLKGLQEWSEKAPLYMFVYDSHREKVSLTSFERIIHLIQTRNYQTGNYPDNNKLYYRVLKDDLIWEDAPEDEREEDTTST